MSQHSLIAGTNRWLNRNLIIITNASQVCYTSITVGRLSKYHKKLLIAGLTLHCIQSTRLKLTTYVLSLLCKPTLLYPNVNLSPSYSPCQLKHCFNHKKSQNVRLNMCLASCTSLHCCVQMLPCPLLTRHVSSNTALITKNHKMYV